MINGETKILGVIGDPIEHTFSPTMHNAGLNAINLNYIYLPFHVKGTYLRKAIEGAKGLSITGLNVTIPHKQAIIDVIDEIDPIAEMIGAVNTVKFDYSDSYDADCAVITKGYNTDGYGCVRAIKEQCSLKNKKITITGAGGAARAIAFQISNSGINELSLLNRSFNKAESLAKDLENNLSELDIDVSINAYGLDNLKRELDDSDVLIDTSPLGMYPNINEKPVADANMLHEDLVVNDIVYTPMETSLIKEAIKANSKIVPGYKMLLYQGIRSFEIWLDVEAPVDVMEKALLNVLGI